MSVILWGEELLHRVSLGVEGCIYPGNVFSTSFFKNTTLLSLKYWSKRSSTKTSQTNTQWALIKGIPPASQLHWLKYATLHSYNFFPRLCSQLPCDFINSASQGTRMFPSLWKRERKALPKSISQPKHLIMSFIDRYCCSRKQAGSC